MKRTLLTLCLAAFLTLGCADSTTATKDAGAPADTPKTEAPVTEAPKTEPSKTETATEATPAADQAEVKLGEKPKDGEEVAVLETTQGRIVLRFFPSKAPKHVENFKKLANSKFYDGTKFHRVIPGFMIQGGDPNSKNNDKSDDGIGGAESNVPAEFNDIPHKRGVLSMARSQDPNSASSQFFIVVKDSNFLDGQYSAFGEVVTGMDVADKIVAVDRDANDNPNKPQVVKTVRIVKWPVK